MAKADRLTLHDQFLANALIHVTSRWGYDETFRAVVAEMRRAIPGCNWNSARMVRLIEAAQAIVEADAKPKGKIRDDALFAAVHDARHAVVAFSEWRMRMALDAIAKERAKERAA